MANLRVVVDRVISGFFYTAPHSPPCARQADVVRPRIHSRARSVSDSTVLLLTANVGGGVREGSRTCALSVYCVKGLEVCFFRPPAGTEKDPLAECRTSSRTNEAQLLDASTSAMVALELQSRDKVRFGPRGQRRGVKRYSKIDQPASGHGQYGILVEVDRNGGVVHADPHKQNIFVCAAQPVML